MRGWGAGEGGVGEEPYLTIALRVERVERVPAECMPKLGLPVRPLKCVV